jgi:hypothetical protein
MKRYSFEYVYQNSTSQFSIVANDEEEAKNQIKERVADIEFATPEEITITKLVKSFDDKDNYYECEGCT